MTDQQKRAATALSLLTVAGAALFLIWLAVVVAMGSARGDLLPGRLFMLAVANWDGLAILLKTLPVVLSVGLTLLSWYKLKDAFFYSVVAVSVLGLIATVYLFMELSAVSTAKNFWAYSPTGKLEDYQSFVAATQKGLSVIGIWLLSIVAAELGIKLSSSS